MNAKSTFSHHPENAALLYYQACLIMQKPEKEMGEKLIDVLKGNVKPDKEIKKYIDRCHRLIEIIEDAAKSTTCDWGLDYSSKGVNVVIHYLSDCRQLTYITLAKAQICVSEGDYKKSLNLCLVILKMSNDVCKGDLLCYLCGAAIAQLTNECIGSILNTTSIDPQILLWFEEQLKQVEKNNFPFKSSVNIEFEKLSVCMNKEKFEKQSDYGFFEFIERELPNNVSEFAAEKPDDFLNKNRLFWDDYIARVKAALDLPYSKAYSNLTQLFQDVKKRINNPTTALTAFFSSNFPLCYSISTRTNNFCRIIQIAVGLFIFYSQNSRLPDELPKDSSLDLFSDKKFKYIKMPDSFSLRCPGKDIVKNKFHEYKFNLPH
jgi:hypothetical protein